MKFFVEKAKKLGVDVVGYADDAVCFSDLPIPVELTPEGQSAEQIKNRRDMMADTIIGDPDALIELGLEFAPQKCGYVKFAGNELKPLKFLGLELSKNFVRAHTRKGSRLELSGREQLLGELFYELHDKCQALSVDEALELFEKTIEEHKTYPDPVTSFEKIFERKLAGFIISRLQQGS